MEDWSLNDFWSFFGGDLDINKDWFFNRIIDIFFYLLWLLLNVEDCINWLNYMCSVILYIMNMIDGIGLEIIIFLLFNFFFVIRYLNLVVDYVF